MTRSCTKTNIVRNPVMNDMMEYIRAHPGCTMADIRRELGADTASQNLRKMHNHGMICKVGSKGSASRWRAVR